MNTRLPRARLDGPRFPNAVFPGGSLYFRVHDSEFNLLPCTHNRSSCLEVNKGSLIFTVVFKKYFKKHLPGPLSLPTCLVLLWNSPLYIFPISQCWPLGFLVTAAGSGCFKRLYPKHHHPHQSKVYSVLDYNCHGKVQGCGNIDTPHPLFLSLPPTPTSLPFPSITPVRDFS